MEITADDAENTENAEEEESGIPNGCGEIPNFGSFLEALIG